MSEVLDSEAPDASEDQPSGFATLGLRSELLSALTTLGYEEPTPIQRETIPLLLEGGDLLGQAATGTGKTAAFALPVLNGIEPNDARITTALVLVPTRELAMQVSEAMHKYGSKQGVKVLPIYGGQPIGRQLDALRRGVHVVVATPGRALDHIRRRSLDLDAIRTVILDEADEMLDMGFSEDLEEILQATPDDRQTVLFSATMPPRINAIAKKYQRDPQRVQIGGGKTTPGTSLIKQSVYFVPRNHKPNALGRILDIEAPTAALVFCRTRNEVDTLTETMNGRGYRAEALHGGMNQQQRDRVMSRLRDGAAELLLATDVAARGLDVDTLTHVINFEVPSAPESYVHRIGRVGRAGREGIAITLAEPKQKRLLKNIERLTKQNITVKKVPSVADLRARQIELTVTALREALASDDLEDYSAVLDTLSVATVAVEEPAIDEPTAGGSASEVPGSEDDAFESLAFEPLTVDEQEPVADEPVVERVDLERLVALAAIKLVHEGRGAELDEVEIPDASYRDNKQDHRPGNKHRKSGSPKEGGKFTKKSRDHNSNGESASVYIGVGRKAGVRPGDLVGAIANEAGLSGKEIGPIRISDHYSVVGVPADAVDRVIAQVGGASVRGKKMKVRRYVE